MKVLKNSYKNFPLSLYYDHYFRSTNEKEFKVDLGLFGIP